MIALHADTTQGRPARPKARTPVRCHQSLSRRCTVAAAVSLAACVARLPGLLAAQAAAGGADPALLRAFRDAMAAQGDAEVRVSANYDCSALAELAQERAPVSPAERPSPNPCYGLSPCAVSVARRCHVRL